MEVKAYYRVLNLEPGARRTDVILAYRRQMLLWHPERAGRSSDPEAMRKYRSIVAAYRSAMKDVPAKPHLSSRSRTESAIDSSPISMPFRSHQTPPQPVLLKFTPATTPSAKFALRREALAPSPNLPVSRQDHPLVSTIAFSAILIVLLCVGLSLANSGGQKKAFETVSASSQKVLPPVSEVHPIEKAPPQAVVLTGRVLARSNRAGTSIELIPYGGTERLTVNERSPNTFESSELPAGDYRLIARSEGWPDISLLVTIAPEKDTELLVSFKGGSLRIESDPSNAVVRIGSKILGRTPAVITDLPPGSQIVSVRYGSWPEIQITASVSEGAETKQAIHIPYGRLIIESAPNGALLSVDGEEIGKTPLTMAQIPAGKRQLKLTADNYEAYEVSVSIYDGNELKIHPILNSSVTALDPDNLLKQVWITKQSNGRDYDVAPNFDKINAFRPKNGVIKNIDRQKLFGGWAGRPFRYSGSVKAFDPKTGIVEFVEQTGEKSKYRVTAQLDTQTKTDASVINRLQKGAVIELWGALSDVEEPRWPSKTISLELTGAKPVR